MGDLQTWGYHHQGVIIWVSSPWNHHPGITASASSPPEKRPSIMYSSMVHVIETSGTTGFAAPVLDWQIAGAECGGEGEVLEEIQDDIDQDSEEQTTETVAQEVEDEDKALVQLDPEETR